MNRNFKKKTWAEIKTLVTNNSTSELDYIKRTNRYKIILPVGDTTFFTNLYNPNTKLPRNIDALQNDVDYTDFEANYITIINDVPPSSTSDVIIKSNLFPVSDLDGTKVSVHSSSKPTIKGKITYAVWSGSGDSEIDNSLCTGDLIELDLVPGKPTHSINVRFNPSMNGRVWLHEAYLKFENGGKGDYIDGQILSDPTPLQQAVSLDLVVMNNMIKYSPAGPGTGTHGFADPTKIVLIPKTFAKDGAWDYDGTNLIPNMTGEGSYSISDIEQVVHKYINKIPCRGSCPTYFSMTSDETTEIHQNYFMRITAHNISDTAWFACAVMEIFRERTIRI